MGSNFYSEQFTAEKLQSDMREYQNKNCFERDLTVMG
jgi:hypothetical protein